MLLDLAAWIDRNDSGTINYMEFMSAFRIGGSDMVADPNPNPTPNPNNNPNPTHSARQSSKPSSCGAPSGDSPPAATQSRSALVRVRVGS